MPPASRAPRTETGLEAAKRYTMEELWAVRRNVLVYARSFPPGPERNQRRQVARSLRALFRNPAWLDRNTVEGAPRPPARVRGLRSVLV